MRRTKSREGWGRGGTLVNIGIGRKTAMRRVGDGARGRGERGEVERRTDMGRRDKWRGRQRKKGNKERWVGGR